MPSGVERFSFRVVEECNGRSEALVSSSCNVGRHRAEPMFFHIDGAVRLGKDRLGARFRARLEGVNHLAAAPQRHSP